MEAALIEALVASVAVTEHVLCMDTAAAGSTVRASTTVVVAIEEATVAVMVVRTEVDAVVVINRQFQV